MAIRHDQGIVLRSYPFGEADRVVVLREGHTLEQAAAVVRLKVREWQGTEMARYVRPATLFGPKFDSYVQETTNGHARGVNARWDGVAGGEVALSVADGREEARP